MVDSEGRIELTPDLLEYAKAVTIKTCQKHAPPHVKYDDVVQEVMVHLLSKPPEYDDSHGATEKSFIHTVVQRFVFKFLGKEAKHAKRNQQFDEKEKKDSDVDHEGKLADPRAGTQAARGRMIDVMDAEEADDASPLGEAIERHPTDLTRARIATDAMFDLIDDGASHELLQIMMECEGNKSEAARRMGVSEGTLRYRLEKIRDKLRRSGFDPFAREEDDEDQ